MNPAAPEYKSADRRARVNESAPARADERARRAAAGLEVAADNHAVLDAVMERIAPWLDRLTPHAASAYA